METASIKTSLTIRLAELESRLKKIERDASKSYSTDSAEQAQERENDEVLDQIGNETRESIVQINKALKRLEHNEYGVCESCGEEINNGRLSVIPETVYCVSCAN